MINPNEERIKLKNVLRKKKTRIELTKRRGIYLDKIKQKIEEDKEEIITSENQINEVTSEVFLLIKRIFWDIGYLPVNSINKSIVVSSIEPSLELK